MENGRYWPRNEKGGCKSSCWTDLDKQSRGFFSFLGCKACVAVERRGSIKKIRKHTCSSFLGGKLQRLTAVGTGSHLDTPPTGALMLLASLALLSGVEVLRHPHDNNWKPHRHGIFRCEPTRRLTLQPAMQRFRALVASFWPKKPN